MFQIKDHDFFKGICWEDVLHKTIAPPIDITKREVSSSELENIEYGSERCKENENYRELNYQKKENIVLSETDDEETL